MKDFLSEISEVEFACSISKPHKNTKITSAAAQHLNTLNTHYLINNNAQHTAIECKQTKHNQVKKTIHQFDNTCTEFRWGKAANGENTAKYRNTVSSKDDNRNCFHGTLKRDEHTRTRLGQLLHYTPFNVIRPYDLSTEHYTFIMTVRTTEDLLCQQFNEDEICKGALVCSECGTWYIANI